MSIVTIFWSMTAAACLILSLVYLVVWVSRDKDHASLAFAAGTLGVVGLALVELILMQAQSVDTYAWVQRMGHVPAFMTMVGLAAFVHFYFRAGLVWWLWLIVAMRVIVLLINFSGPGSLNFREITGLEPFELFGETVAVAVGVSNPWGLLGLASLIALAAFTLHSSLLAWRRNEPRDRQRALVIGSAIVTWVVLCMGNMVLMNAGQVHVPYFLSPAFLFVVLAVSYEFGVDLVRFARLARELRDSVDMLELSSEAANLGFWEYEPATDRFTVTDKVRQLFGFSASEPVCMESWLARVHPDDLPAVRATARSLPQGPAEFRSTYRLLLPDEAVRWVFVHGRRILTKQIQLHGIVMDITQQQLERNERIRLWEEFARIGRASVLGQLTASIAHELNQPLGAILRNAEAAELLLAADPPDLNELRDIVTDIRRDDRRASKVIQQLRGLLSAHQLQTRSVDIAVLIGEAVELLMPEAEARGIRIRQVLDSACVMVQGDPVHLQQVLLNLMMNGMDAAQLVRQGESWVTISTRLRDDRMVEITVSDSGPGVAPGKVDQVFDSFYTTKPNGMGLGLSICRTIVEAHGGRIWLDADAGRGAVFRFTLPGESPGATD